jgi:hypothetical protein
VSILKPLDRDETGWYTSSQGTHELGGGNLVQTYVWAEEYDPCDPLSRWGFANWPRHKILEWNTWSQRTQPIPEWGEAF